MVVCVEAVLATAEYPAYIPVIVAFAVLFHAVGLTALASFLYLFYLDSQGEAFGAFLH